MPSVLYMTPEEIELCGDRLDSVRDLLELLPNEIGSWKYAYWYKVYQYLDEKLEAAEKDE
jgi:hypothetical protein